MIIDVNHATPWEAGDTVTAMLRPGITEVIGMPRMGRDRTSRFLTSSAVAEARTILCLLEDDPMVNHLREDALTQRGTLKNCVIEHVSMSGCALSRKIMRNMVKDMLDNARPGDFCLIDGSFCQQDRNDISQWANNSRATFIVLAGVLPSMNVPNHDLLIHRTGRPSLKRTGIAFPEDLQGDLCNLESDQAVLYREGALKRISIAT
jgi:hypothetical protein